MSSELMALLAPAYPGRTIRAVRARPYPYATSFHLDELTVETDDGECDHLILKDFARSRMLPEARSRRPVWADHPDHEIETYRRVLSPGNIGPACRATVADAKIHRFWLITDKVAGVELWQVGDIRVWEQVLRWLTEFHATYSDLPQQVLAEHPGVCVMDAAWFAEWTARARVALAASLDSRAGLLRDLVDRLDLADQLGGLPRTFVHGEFYAANVIVGIDGERVRVTPVDWETAALGPALIDVAAITAGWDEQTESRLVGSYGDLPGSEDDLVLCRLHLALRWIGWSEQWVPPVEQRQDWIGIALRLVERSGR